MGTMVNSLQQKFGSYKNTQVGIKYEFPTLILMIGTYHHLPFINRKKKKSPLHNRAEITETPCSALTPPLPIKNGDVGIRVRVSHLENWLPLRRKVTRLYQRLPPCLLSRSPFGRFLSVFWISSIYIFLSDLCVFFCY